MISELLTINGTIRDIHVRVDLVSLVKNMINKLINKVQELFLIYIGR